MRKNDNSLKNVALVLLGSLVLAVAVTVSGCGQHETVITRFDDAKHARIGVMVGTTGEMIAKTRFPDAKVQSFDDIMDSVSAMKSGKLEAVITTYPTAIMVTKRHPEFRVLSEALKEEFDAIAVRKGDDALLAAVNDVIAGLKSDGTLADMRKRWLKSDLGPYQELSVEVPTTGAALRVGVSATREPLSFVDKNGRVSGHDGELARIIGGKLQRPVVFSDMKFLALIPALKSGKIDMILTDMVATDERRKSVDFSQPYFTNSQVMLVKKGGVPASHPAKLNSVADLADKRIGVLLGSVHDSYALKTYPVATVLQYRNPSDIILAVKSGKVDAAIYSHESLLEILRTDGELGLLGEKLFTLPMGMGFNKKNVALRVEFNDFLKRIKENGDYADMLSRWIEKGDSHMPETVTANPNGTLVVGIVSDKGLPFATVKDGKVVGLDIELCERFAAHIGKELKLVDMEFGSLIAAVSTNKIDMIASTLLITEERQKLVGFSDSYYPLGASVFALKTNIAAFDSAAPGVGRPLSFFDRVANSFRANIIQEKRYLLILDGLKTTIVIAVLATLFGSLLGALVCYMRMSRNPALNLPAKVYISILRGTPVLVLLMLIFYVVFASVNVAPVLVAVVAFGMNFAAYVAEIFRTGIEGIDKGQSEAGISMGFTKGSTFLHIVLPQTVRRILPVYKGEFISLVKMTSIVGYIAVQDLTKASDIIRSRTFDAFFPLIMVAVLYFLVSWLLLRALGFVERKTDPRSGGGKRRNA